MLIFLNHSLEFYIAYLHFCAAEILRHARSEGLFGTFCHHSSSELHPLPLPRLHTRTAHPLKNLTFQILSLTVFKLESRQLDPTILEAQASVAHSSRRELLCHFYFRSKTIPLAAPAGH